MPAETSPATRATPQDSGAVAGLPRDPAQESLASALRASFNILRLIMVVLLAAYFLSGWFKVEPGEQGLVVRFGKLRSNPARGGAYAGTHVFGSGSHWALPDPFDEKIHLPGEVFELEVDAFLFSRAAKDIGKPLSEILPDRDRLRPGVDGAMLTGDQSLAHGLWRIQYRIASGDRFVQAVGDTVRAAEPLLQRLAESAIIGAAAGRSVDDVLGKQIEGLTRDVRNRLQRDLTELGCGLTVTKVVADTIEPGRVRPAFRRVSQAENEKRRLIEQAQQRRQEILNQAAGPQYRELLRLIRAYGAAQTAGADEQRLAQLRRRIDAALDHAGGQVAKLLRQAQTRDSEIRETLRREYEEFVTHLEAYRKYPDLTLAQLWAQTRTAILSSAQNEVFYVPPFGKIEILVNRDPNRALQADVERYRARYGPKHKPE